MRPSARSAFVLRCRKLKAKVKLWNCGVLRHHLSALRLAGGTLFFFGGGGRGGYTTGLESLELKSEELPCPLKGGY